MLKKYNGPIGNFEYDDSEFRIDSYFGYLHYIGSETDGTKIHIPEGIVDCGYMFYNCKKLKTAPTIPNGVKICKSMFSLCQNLKTASEIPGSVTDCNSMFFKCENLEIAPEIPNGVENCDFMFFKCEKLKTYAEHPRKATTFEMYKGCVSLFWEFLK